MAELQKMLWAAERPIAILGGGGWTKRASAALARFAERFDMPVAGSFRRESAFDGEHENYAGEIGLSANPKLKAQLADLGGTVLPGPAADFGKLIAEETEKWAEVVKLSGGKPN